jgi:hypothetical protein
MTESDLQAIEGRCEAATPGPWRDLTEEWNESLRAYSDRNGRPHHGGLRKNKKMDSKEAMVLIVQDSYHGEPIDMARVPYGPDWWELNRIVAVSVEMWTALNKTSTGFLESAVENPLRQGVADRAFIAAARQDVPDLIAEVRRLRELVISLGGYEELEVMEGRALQKEENQ